MLEATKDRVVRLVAQATHNRYRRVGDEVLTGCPFCGETRLKFSFNLEKRKGHCWICETSVHSLEDWLKRVIGVDNKKFQLVFDTLT